MSKVETVFNMSTHVRNESHSKKQCDDMVAESTEKVALAIGRQLLKRGLIKMELEENPGPNAGEKKITLKGIVRAENPKTEK